MLFQLLCFPIILGALGIFVSTNSTTCCIKDDYVYSFFERYPDECLQKINHAKQMKPMMTRRDSQMITEAYSKHKRYFEIGTGGSTFTAVKQGVLVMGAVESDRDWHNLMKRVIPTECGANLQLVDFYTKNCLGYPAKNTTYEDWKKYFRSYNPEYKADMIMIDGRFRVACALNILPYITNETAVFIHDFFDRPRYHVVLQFYNIVNKGDVLVELRKNGKMPSKELIDKYEHIAD